MHKIVLANIIWFIIVTVGSIISAFDRHRSESWAQMPDIRFEYDVVFTGGFIFLCISSIVGLVRNRKYGYECAMGFNYILTLFAFIPLTGLVLHGIKHDIPVAEVVGIAWRTNTTESVFISVVSALFIWLMRKPNIKAQLIRNTHPLK